MALVLGSAQPCQASRFGLLLPSAALAVLQAPANQLEAAPRHRQWPLTNNSAAANSLQPRHVASPGPPF